MGWSVRTPFGREWPDGPSTTGGAVVLAAAGACLAVLVASSEARAADGPLAATPTVSGAVSSDAPAPRALSAAKAQAADALIAQFLARVHAAAGPLPKASLAVSIGSQDGLALAKGYGDMAPGVPATAETIYHIGSLAKQFTAAAVLDLIGRKATLRDGTPLTLDLALARIFTGVEHWPGVDARNGAQPVTLRSLLTMTSNLPNFTRVPPSATNPWGRIGAPELLSELKKLRPSGWPNTFEYSNTSYFLLAEVIEEAVAPGDTLPRAHNDALRRAIFPRAALVDTGFVGDDMRPRATARPIYRKRPIFDQPDWLKGSADIASSATDLYAWNAALMAGRVLPRDLLALMLSDGARVTPDLYYGMGWFVEHRAGRDVYWHSGLVPGYTSYNMISAAPETKAEAAGAESRRAWTSVTLLVNTDFAEGLDVLADDLIRLARE